MTDDIDMSIKSQVGVTSYSEIDSLNEEGVPERALYAAMLDRAVRDIQKLHGDWIVRRSLTKSQDAAWSQLSSAIDWLNDPWKEDAEAPSFPWVCTMLGGKFMFDRVHLAFGSKIKALVDIKPRIDAAKKFRNWQVKIGFPDA